MDSVVEKTPWKVEDEILLFDLICDYKPAGERKDKNLKIICSMLSEKSKTLKLISVEDILAKLEQFYNLDMVEKVENENEDSESFSERSSIGEVHAKEENDASTNQEKTEAAKTNEINEKPKRLNSEGQSGEESSLSEIEIDTEDENALARNITPEVEASKKISKDTPLGSKAHDSPSASSKSEVDMDSTGKLKRITRGSSKNSDKTPVPKKRTRSTAKLEISSPSHISKKVTRKNASPSTVSTHTNSQTKKNESESEQERPTTRRSTRNSAMNAATPPPPTTPNTVAATSHINSPKSQPVIRRSSRRK